MLAHPRPSPPSETISYLQRGGWRANATETARYLQLFHHEEKSTTWADYRWRSVAGDEKSDSKPERERERERES